MNVLAIRLPSESMFSFELSTYSVWGIPMSVSPSGLAMDVDRQYSLVKALDGNTDKPKQFFLNSGSTGSALEHSVPEQLWSTPDNPAYGISAVKALKIANDQGIPIYTINQTNIDTILPQLQIDTDAKTDIRNAVNAGKVVTVSKTNITYNGWTGCGYIIIDPDTGEGAYMIGGGMSGGIILAMGILAFLVFVFAVLSVASAWALVAILNAPLVIAVFSSLFFMFNAYFLVIIEAAIASQDIHKTKEFAECLIEFAILHVIIHALSNMLPKRAVYTLLEILGDFIHATKFTICLKELVE